MASDPGISLHVTIYIDPSNVEKFFEYMKPAYDAVIAEPECRFFEIYQDPKEPGTLSWVENWDATPEWLVQTQLQRDYYKPYMAATEPMFVKPREYKLYKRLGKPFYTVKDQ
ncbi:hypothetical protein N7456_012242 [Penicillium angulare]|uniref:ABM domain-containing protein n=1 Tax=Penicillium angulare TaxID=116970 RepID=A0A9W9EVG3_9EURO|nr:hypothetical protein N7456_012242 [Penicillium angulare]